ncbi:MAG: Tol-Pal system beta propeller repeat protein TolB [Methylococcales bacterium]|nr:Tol-Pal system beta propeller repeat protein TolB [Methylococcales bacterium]
MKTFSSFIFLSVWLIYSPFLHAELNIDITKSFESKVPIAVPPFGSFSRQSVNIAGVISADLSRSGYFQSLPENDMLSRPTSADQVVFKNWKVLGQDYLLVGRIDPRPANTVIFFQLFDISKKEQIMDYQITSHPRGLRQAAHRISDLVYKKLTGKKGVFGTKVAYVSSKGGVGSMSYRLQIADVDGYNAQTVVSSRQPIMSPTWSPNSKKIAYVSFENNRAAIYVQDVATGKRTKISSFPGINGAPAWSPDGRKLALTLSKGGSPDIYVLDVVSKQLTQVTHNLAINTEPTWAPDGASIVYTSNQAGGPQLFRVSTLGGKAQRLTFKGNYNASANFSPDGSKIAMVHASGKGYKIGLLDLKTKKFTVLTSGSLDESPSFANNGTMVLYAARRGGRGILSAVSIDGKIHQKLEFQNPEVREPAWAP